MQASLQVRMRPHGVLWRWIVMAGWSFLLGAASCEWKVQLKLNRLPVSIAVENLNKPFYLETDCLDVIEALKSKYRIKARWFQAIEETRLLLLRAQVGGIAKVARSQNIGAHILAQFSRAHLSGGFLLRC